MLHINNFWMNHWTCFVFRGPWLKSGPEMDCRKFMRALFFSQKNVRIELTLNRRPHSFTSLRICYLPVNLPVAAPLSDLVIASLNKPQILKWIVVGSPLCKGVLIHSQLRNQILFKIFPKIPHLLIPFDIVIHVRFYVDFEIFLWVIRLLLWKFWTFKICNFERE